MKEAGLTNCKWTNPLFKECDFDGASFTGTPLRNIDMSSCSLENLIVSENHHELSGMKISHAQAASIAALLGVTIEN
jgi:uncharacterized protein YjbI with pentapeptide repeats